MSIRRAPRQTNFTVLPNTALNDNRLSFKARGLLTYILSKPDHWKTNSQHLGTVGPDGLTSVRSGLRELSEIGYAVLTKERNPDGTIASEWEIRDTPVRNPTLDSPTLVQPNFGKPVPLVSTEGVNTDLANTEKRSSRASGFQNRSAPEQFKPAATYEELPLLAKRLVDVCTGPRERTIPEAHNVIRILRKHFDDRIIDEGIGVCARLATLPVLPRYLFSVMNDRAEETGLFVPVLSLESS